MDRTILHVDMDAFYASVEQHDHPEYRGKPVVIGSPPDRRGVVAAASYEAREFGIRSAMPSREAGRRCPDAIFLAPRMKRYLEVSKQIRKCFERFSPLVEPLSVDEAFIDVTGSQRIFGTGPEIAAKIKALIRDETGLTASVGVAHNKFLAKLASDLEKPDGLTVVPSDPVAIREFLAPLPVSRVWGVGKVMQQRLESIGIIAIGQLQSVDEQKLIKLVGPATADHLRTLATGADSRELDLDRVEESVSREHTFLDDCTNPEILQQTLCELVTDVGIRLRAKGKYAGTAHLKLRWQGFQTITRQRQFPEACCDDFTLRDMALSIFHDQELVSPVRLIGFGVSKLTVDRDPAQLGLFDEGGSTLDKRESLIRAVDDVRKRFGRNRLQDPRGQKSAD
jgi:DNA polymerase-4